MGGGGKVLEGKDGRIVEIVERLTVEIKAKRHGEKEMENLREIDTQKSEAETRRIDGRIEKG